MDNVFRDCKCVAILGGTFNPVHNGHIMMSECVFEQISDVQKVVFMPNNLPLYKDTTDMVSKEHRINMLSAALKGKENIDISTLELTRGGATYTVDTIKQIKEYNPDIKLYFIIGDDSLLSFNKWYKYDKILQNCILLVAARSCSYEEIETNGRQLIRQAGCGDIRVLKNNTIEVSSSDIRRRIAKGDMPSALIPERVAEYIKHNELYGWRKHES